MRFRHLRRTFISMLVLIALLPCISACKKVDQPESSAISEPQSSQVEAEVSEPLMPVPDPFRSVTTGRLYPEETAFYPILLMIENSREARPQTGLMQADIIYEAPVEGTITRFACLFNDTLPTVAGPVRSSRMYYLGIQQEWDSIYMHYGGPNSDTSEATVYGSKYDYIRVRIDGLKGKYDKFYWRSSDRKAPHNVYTDLTYVKEQYPDFASNRSQHWKFSDAPSTSDISAGRVHIPFISSQTPNVEFVYDEASKTYQRFENGAPFYTTTIDAEGGSKTEQVAVNNLIVQYVSMQTLDDSDGHRIIHMVNSGNCEVFIEGKQLSGTWARTSEADITHYYDAEGNEITFAVGNTWIALQPDTKTITVTP